MKKLIAAICFMFALSPLALAQDKGKSDEKKAAPAAEKPAKAAEKPAKKEPTEKQKAQQEKMKACSGEASQKKMKGDERKKFMSECMKSQPAKAPEKKAQPAKAPEKK
jgi:uncharacterized protein YdeI (BOF family)